MTVPREHVELIQSLFQEINANIMIADAHDRLNYAFQVIIGGEGYEFICPRRPFDDENVDELRRRRDQFLLSYVMQRLDRLEREIRVRRN